MALTNLYIRAVRSRKFKGGSGSKSNKKIAVKIGSSSSASLSSSSSAVVGGVSSVGGVAVIGGGAIAGGGGGSSSPNDTGVPETEEGQ